MVPARRALSAITSAALVACAGSAPPPVAERAVPSASAVSVAAPPPTDDVASAPEDAGIAPELAQEPAAPAVIEPRPRLTSLAFVTWIWPHPKAGERFLGVLKLGQSVALRSVETVAGEGCAGGFYAIEPRGYVCRGKNVTLAPPPRFDAEARAIAPKPLPLPYGYALSGGAPMYNRIPSPEQQRRAERVLGKAGAFRPLVRQLAAHEDLADAEPVAADDVAPAFVTDGEPLVEGRRDLVNQLIPLGSMLSFGAAYDVGGRTFLLSADLTLVPADRVRPFRPSSFHGAKLGPDLSLPIAWMRREARPKWRRLAPARFERTAEAWAARSFVRLTGTSEEQGGATWLETSDEDVGGSGANKWIAESDATIVRREAKLPFGVKPAQKWIVVRITQGTLVAYEGEEPVYATLVSPGAGGVPVPGQDPVKASTTPLGSYSITFKDRAATMSPDKDPANRTFWIADVPHTQYFAAPFALHAAYWHERFGEPTSAGCINLSPIDAQALFAWSDPVVPEGWSGATGAGAPENGGTTAVIVRR